MKNYRVLINSIGKSFLVDLKSRIHYFLNYICNTYFAKEAREFRTIEEGSWYYLDGRYILCSEDVMHHIYK